MSYTSYLTSENQQPNFLAIVNNLTIPFTDIQGMNVDLNVNTATGAMLDIIGEWVGISRYLPVPIDIVLLWDNTSRTWDSGYIWANESTSPTGLTRLDDTSYRFVIKFEILKNHYDGTKQTAYNILSTLLSTSSIVIEDTLSMSMNVIIAGATLDTITQALLTGGYLNFAPFGVRQQYIVTPSQSGLMFAWDNLTAPFGGWDTAYWAKF
ncbi:MAG TPA: DUF2612 domain-containing protein [Methanosarcina sp.]|nr:DUF2612 domain-containing protein [Methanosarcina sp.]